MINKILKFLCPHFWETINSQGAIRSDGSATWWNTLSRCSRCGAYRNDKYQGGK